MSITAKKIQETYCNHLCEIGERPVTIVALCKKLKIEEGNFYEHFSSFENLESTVFESFFKNVMALLEKDENYLESDSQNKLLSFYYTFFEVLLSNRTLVLLLLPSDSKKWMFSNNLNHLKNHFQDFVDSLNIELSFLQNTPLASYQDKSIRAVAWLQLLKTMDFWKKDESKGFDKTDIYIEKSLKASFDLIHKNPFESLIDFGKFVYHETVKKH
jgi:AcrR family transcriptional regulator